MSVNNATSEELLVSEKVRRSGRDRVAENSFHVKLACNVNLSESFVIVEEAVLSINSVHWENGCCRSISD